MKVINLRILVVFLIVLSPFSAIASEPRKIVLVLGGGGSRGLAHIGVIEELENLGIVPDIIVGCSSGAIVGALYAEHQDIARVKKLLINLTQDDLLDLTFFKKYAFSSRRKLKKFLNKNLKSTDFASLQIPFIAVATDLNKGEPIYFRKGDLHPAILASSAMPVLFPPYKIGNRVFVDGGLCDPLPVLFARSLGDVVIIASDASSALDGFTATNMVEVIRKSLEIVYQRLAYNSQQEADILLRMNFFGVDSPIVEGMNHKLYKRGKQAVRNQSKQIKKIIQEARENS